MSTPTSQFPTDVPTLHNILKTLIAKLFAHQQTTNELLRANTDLRAALHLAEQGKGEIEAYVHNLLNPQAAVAPVATPAAEAPVATDAPATDAPAADANTVPA
jgi:hypothetical protein